MSAQSQSLKELFVAALEVAPEERAAWLDRECPADEALREHLRLLLAAHDTPQSLLDRPAAAESLADVLLAGTAGPTIDQPIIERPGMQIGPYNLMEQIGQGGMGLVFVAEQHSPVRRKVALKVIKPGMDTRDVIARFEAERQALALMDHPNIAKVLDAGATGPASGYPGRPYFVMELVKGTPITHYCDENRLNPRDRLELFTHVCHAVQHAHQKGIIHRDIKPSNVLVASHDGRPVVKVIDFGVAKAIGQQLTEQTIYTAMSQMVGTPLYMSPEQAGMSSLDIDTRSDIYSLGVLLYELLTGTTPFDKQRLKNAAYEEMRRIIRDEEPQKPSTRISTTDAGPSIAAQRNTEAAKLSKLIRGDLDWIVMKALEKDRNRRYETAVGFAADVQRYLADEPVQACPPSAAYRLRKYARRHKGPVLAASLIWLALVAGVIGTTWGLIRAEKQRIVVARQNDELADRNQALQAAHERERLLNERARQAIETVASDQAIDQLAREKQLRPDQEEFLAKMIQYYAESAQGVADTEQERSRQARAYYRMGRMNHILGRSPDAENAYRRAVAIRRQLAADFPNQPEFRKDLAYTQNFLGVLLSSTRSRESEAAYDEALAILQQLAIDSPDRAEFRQVLAGVHNNLGNVFLESGRPQEAEDAQVKALEIRKQLAADFPNQPNIHRALAMSHNNLGWIFHSSERLTQAETAYRDAVAFQRQQVAEFPNPPEYRLELAKYLFNLGNMLRDTARPKEAQAAHAEALTIYKQIVAEFPNRPEFRKELADAVGEKPQPVTGAQGLEEDGHGSEAEPFDFPNK